MERRGVACRLCTKVFRYFLANHLLQIPAKNQFWLSSFPPLEWLPEFLSQLDRATAALATEIHSGRVPGIGWLFQQFEGIRGPRQLGPRESGPRYDEAYDFASAAADALTDIGFEMLAYARGRTLPSHVERHDLEMLVDSGLWFSRPWLNALACERRAWLSASALEWLIERETAVLETKVDEFSSRAETCCALATVCAWHSDGVHAQAFTRLASDNFLTHGGHKDVLLFHTLDAIMEFARASTTPNDGAREWLIQLATPIEYVRDFTDGDETRYLPGKLAEALLVVAPALFRPYYEHLCDSENYWEATRAFNVFIEQADLGDLDNQALARTALDLGALKILEGRAATGDAGAGAVRAALLRELGEGAFDNLEDERSSSTHPQQVSADPPPAPEKFPPVKLEHYLEASRDSVGLESRALERWLAYWKQRATAAELFEALRKQSENTGRHFRHHDELYELARLHLGNSGAFRWLVAAQASGCGWRTGWSDDDAARRFELVRVHYPAQWEEFLHESVLHTWKELGRGGVIGNANWPRLTEFLMVVGQHSLAQSLVEQMVSSTLEMVSPQKFSPPGWTGRKAAVNHDRLSMLFDRLLWPSCYVKERACRELAALFIQNSSVPAFSDALFAWIVRQQLESTCAYGLLVLVRAKLDGALVDASRVGKLASQIKAPSLLSALLFEELGLPVDENISKHSGEAPSNYSSPGFFGEHVESFLPPVVHDWAQRIEENERVPFMRQWSYEWSVLMGREGIEASTEAGKYWARSSSHKRFAPADTRISEIYRSAFLRALAWASQCRKVKYQNTRFFAARTCPVDVALWRIAVSRAPDWWPFVHAPTGTMDTTPADVWSKVGQLWKKQSAQEPWKTCPLGRDDVLLAAAGPVCLAPHSTELRIWGAFQRCFGAKSPELAAVVETIVAALDGKGRWIRFDEQSLLRCTGALTGAPAKAFAVRVEDWGLVPATFPLCLPTVPRWQAWRMHYSLLAPLPFLADCVLKAELNLSCLQFSPESGPKASWHDWHLGIQERSDRKRAERAGCFLSAPRSWVETAENQLGAKFVWICRLDSHYSKDWSDETESVSDYRIFGATSIVIPE